MDQLFRNPDGAVSHGFEGMVARNAFEFPEKQTRYQIRLKEMLQSGFIADAILKLIDRVQQKWILYSRNQDLMPKGT